MADLYSISILTLVAILALALVSLLLLAYVFGYEMTKNDTEEGRILELCMNLDAYIPNCEMIYGGINTHYGEALK